VLLIDCIYLRHKHLPSDAFAATWHGPIDTRSGTVIGVKRLSSTAV